MHFCFFVVVILYLISQQPIICITRNIIQKDPLKENNIHNLKDPFLILRRCPNLPCQYKNDPEFRHLCPQLSTFDLLPNQHIGEENDEARDYHLMPERHSLMQSFHTKPRRCRDVIGKTFFIQIFSFLTEITTRAILEITLMFV